MIGSVWNFRNAIAENILHFVFIYLKHKPFITHTHIHTQHFYSAESFAISRTVPENI